MVFDDVHANALIGQIRPENPPLFSRSDELRPDTMFDKILQKLLTGIKAEDSLYQQTGPSELVLCSTFYV